VVGEHKAAQRDHILSAALDLLRERGMATLTMSAIAQRAGISRATLYHYFPDVDALLSAWVGREIEASVAAMLASAARFADPLERIEHLVAAQAAAFESQDHRLSAEHFESEAGSPSVRREVATRMAPLRRLLTDTIAEAGRDGRLRAEVDPALSADLLLGMLGAARRHIVSGDLTAAEAVAAVMGLLREGWFA
jgi:AcrR family transcriptional regulator